MRDAWGGPAYMRLADISRERCESPWLEGQTVSRLWDSCLSNPVPHGLYYELGTGWDIPFQLPRPELPVTAS